MIPENKEKNMHLRRDRKQLYTVFHGIITFFLEKEESSFYKIMNSNNRKSRK